MFVCISASVVYMCVCVCMTADLVFVVFRQAKPMESVALKCELGVGVSGYEKMWAYIK